MAVTTTAELLIGQWRNAPRLRGIVQIFLDLVEQELEKPLENLKAMQSVQNAEGVWLDYIGIRVGIRRPNLTAAEAPDISDRFGFEPVGESFDAAPFQGDSLNETVAPAGDTLFRKLVIARGITIVGSPTIGTLRAALAAIDPAATAEDRVDMAVDIRANPAWPVTLAHSLGALPIPAGVRIRLGTGRNWGFDDAGEPFDRAGFEEY